VSSGYPHRVDLEVLAPAARAALGRLARFTSEHGFYLGGGTAIALWLGHRRSVDLDWFRDEAFDASSLLRELREAGTRLEMVAVAEGTLHGLIEEVAVSFLAYRYPALTERLAVGEPAFRIASLDDLACMKLAALLQRGEKKDYFDLFALLDRGETLQRLFGLFERKYGFDPTGSLLRAAIYFDDAEGTPDPVSLWPGLTWDRVKEGLRDAVRRFAAE
jgi:hypothetical protein